MAADADDHNSAHGVHGASKIHGTGQNHDHSSYGGSDDRTTMMMNMLTTTLLLRTCFRVALAVMLTLLEATLFSLSHSMKTSQSTDARSKACGKGGACGVEAPEPHLYLLASPRRPICEWIHLSTYLKEPRNACLKPSSPRRSATSLLHGLHRLRGGGSLRGLHRLHRHGYATG